MPLKEFKADLIPKIRELSVHTKNNVMATALSGELMSIMKGRGIEFEDYRDYAVIDDAQRIDWRASQRAQRLLVREYKVEINLNVFFLIDVSESMLFGSTPKLKCEFAAEVVTSIFFGLLQTGDAIGFGLFNDKLFKVIKPRLAKQNFYIFGKEIAEPKNYGGEKNIGLAMQHMLALLSTKTLIIIVSDFVGIGEEFSDFLKIAASKHEVLGLGIRDPRDVELPSDTGQVIIEDPFSKEKLYIDSKQYQQIYQNYMMKQSKTLNALFQHNKSGLLLLRTDKDPINPLRNFFRSRGGTWR